MNADQTKGGVYNLFLFQNNSKRPARDKLLQLGGIMSSSEELMNAAMPIVNQAMNNPPSSVQMNTMTSNVMPSNITNESLMPSLMDNNPSNIQIAEKLEEKKPVKKLMLGGAIAAGRAAAPMVGRALKQTINIASKPGEFLKGLVAKGDQTLNKAIGRDFVTLGAAAATMQAKIDNISQAQKTNDPDKIKNAITDSVDAPNTKEGLEQTYQYISGEKVPDNLSIDELNRRIMATAMNTSLADEGSKAERLGKAVLFGLGQMKRTAELRAGVGTSGGEKSRQEFLYNSVFNETYKNAIEEYPDNPAEALRLATEAARTAAPNAPAAQTNNLSTTDSTTITTESDLPTITTKEEYDKLPSGSEFIQNGQKRRKP